MASTTRLPRPPSPVPRVAAAGVPALATRAATNAGAITGVCSPVAITASVNHVRAAHGLPPLGEDEVRRHVGRGPKYLLGHTVPGGRARLQATGGGPQQKTYVTELYIYQDAFRNGLSNLASAASVILLLVAIIVLFVQAIARKADTSHRRSQAAGFVSRARPTSANSGSR